jgi:excisionase family DNA binding protein
MKREKKNADVLTVQDVARELGIDDSTVRRYILMGRLPAICIPAGTRNTYRIRRPVFEAFMQQCEASSLFA